MIVKYYSGFHNLFIHIIPFGGQLDFEQKNLNINLNLGQK